MGRALGAAMVAITVFGAGCSGLVQHAEPLALPPAPDEDLSFTPAFDRPGYFYVHESDLERILVRMRAAEEKLRRIYLEHGLAVE